MQCDALWCDGAGLYEPLQCFRGDVCVCVDPHTGLMTSPAPSVVSGDVTCDLGEVINNLNDLRVCHLNSAKIELHYSR